MLALLSIALVPPDLPPLAPREFRAAWVATVDNIDWPSKRDLSTEQAKAELVAILDQAQKIKLNALILQVRPAADALYPSKLEPWSEFLTGAQGRPPSPNWDPLKFAVEEAHKRGLELHAWFNPYRAWHPAAKGKPAPTHISQTTDLAKAYGGYLWLDPGEKRVQDHSIAVMLDVVKRYDLDGVHIDDYFYPYPVKDPSDPEKKRDLPFPDASSYAKYQAGGGKLALGDWRRANVDGFIHRLYTAIKGAKPWVKFGISPFGIYRPGVPQGIQAGIDQYDALYADARKWLVEGWCDYYTPQLYWPIDQKPQSYTVLLDWWKSQNVKKRNLWPGNFTSQILTSAKWPVQEILDQVAATRRALPNRGGNVHFSMKALMNPDKGVAAALMAGPYRDAALIPPSPWLDGKAPATPTVRAVRAGKARTLEIRTKDKDALFAAVYQKQGGKWTLSHVVGCEGSATTGFSPGATSVAVSIIDRCGNEGPRVVLSP
ncbi:MAG: family 10 glycosylhydrolase [Fimbriimonadaceae bacterium]|nr:family 10 glycosylhydrolase [Fimbriimonadaceae bacterium]